MINTRIAKLKRNKRVRKFSKVVAIGLLVCPLTLGAINALADTTETTEPATEETTPDEETAAAESTTSTEPVETVESTPVVEQTQETVVEYVEPESIAPEVKVIPPVEEVQNIQPLDINEGNINDFDLPSFYAEFGPVYDRMVALQDAGVDVSTAIVLRDKIWNYIQTVGNNPSGDWNQLVAWLVEFDAEVTRLENTQITPITPEELGIDVSELRVVRQLAWEAYNLGNGSYDPTSDYYTDESYLAFINAVVRNNYLGASELYFEAGAFTEADIPRLTAEINECTQKLKDGLALLVVRDNVTDEQDPAKDAQIEALREQIDLLIAEIEPLATGTDYQQRYEDLELARIVVITSKANFVDWYGWNYWYNYAIPELERIVNELTKLKADIPSEQVIYRVKYVYEDGMAIPGGYPDWDIRHANAGEEITEVAPEIGNHTLVSEPTQTKIIASDGSTVFTFVYRNNADKTKLETSIQDAEAKLTESGYTADSIKALEQALQNAKDVLANVSSTQAEIDEAQTALDLAIANLVKEDNANGGDNTDNSNNDGNGTNNSNNQNGNTNQDENNNNSSNSSDPNNTNSNNNKTATNNNTKETANLPQTGDTPTNMLISGLTMLGASLVAILVRRRKKA